ncbi:MAG: polymer-forming cytoskeletal protein [Thiotrichales bacterium]|nr:polymer-forming cytoskeletal protein [Thiotrichales bacterium]
MGIFRSSRKSASQEGGKTIIAAGACLYGEFRELKGGLHNDGLIEGVIQTSFDVCVGCSGQIKGLIKARLVVISGVIEGHVACQRLEILPGGKLLGDLICRELIIEHGGKFIGQRHELTESGDVLSMTRILDEGQHKRLLEFAGLHESPTQPEPGMVFEHAVQVGR